MSLRWNLESAERNELNSDGPRLYAICVMAIHCGMPDITADNVDEFWRRVQVIEADDVCGPFRGDDKGPVRFTEEEVRAFTGLRTNVTAYTTRQFTANVNRIKREHAQEAEYRRHKEEQANAR
jgi:hypothetical protein